MRKILTGILIGAIVFGANLAGMEPVSASSASDYKIAKQKIEKSKKKIEKEREKLGQSKNSDEKPPEPPKDENGRPLPPPDKNS